MNIQALPPRHTTPPKMPGLPALSQQTPSQHMKAFARKPSPIWADRMAWRIKAALGEETPAEIEALIIRKVTT